MSPTRTFLTSTAVALAALTAGCGSSASPVGRCVEAMPTVMRLLGMRTAEGEARDAKIFAAERRRMEEKERTGSYPGLVAAWAEVLEVMRDAFAGKKLENDATADQYDANVDRVWCSVTQSTDMVKLVRAAQKMTAFADKYKVPTGFGVALEMQMAQFAVLGPILLQSGQVQSIKRERKRYTVQRSSAGELVVNVLGAK